MLSPSFCSTNAHNSPPIVTRPSTFVSSLIAETLSQKSQLPKQSQTSPRGESGCISDAWSSSECPNLMPYPGGSSHNSSEGVLRYLDGTQSLEDVNVETPIVTYAQQDVQVERFSPYLDEDFSPRRASPVAFLHNGRPSEQEVFSTPKSPPIPNVSRKRSSTFVLSASSPPPSPSPPFPPQRRPARPLSSLPIPSKFRRPRPRISRVDLDRDAVWSTLPSRKRKTPSTASNEHKKGITTTARFSLPIALPPADNASAGTSILRTTSLYRPPPRPPKVESKGEDCGRRNQEGGKPNSAGTASVNGAFGWQLVKIAPSMLKDPKFSTTGSLRL
jgi:hypothetical protein